MKHLECRLVESREGLFERVATLGDILKKLLVVQEKVQTVVIGRKATRYPVDRFFGGQLVDARFIELIEVTLRNGPQVGSGFIVRRC